MQYRQPMHLSLSQMTAPFSSFDGAPTMHADTQAGWSQCMHWTFTVGGALGVRILV